MKHETGQIRAAGDDCSLAIEPAGTVLLFFIFGSTYIERSIKVRRRYSSISLLHSKIPLLCAPASELAVLIFK